MEVCVCVCVYTQPWPLIQEIRGDRSSEEDGLPTAWAE